MAAANERENRLWQLFDYNLVERCCFEELKTKAGESNERKISSHLGRSALWLIEGEGRNIVERNKASEVAYLLERLCKC